MTVRSLVACAAMVLGACTDTPEPTGPAVTSRVGFFEYPYSGRPDLDLLFVIDSSTAMAPYHDDVVAQIPQFVDVLASVEGGTPDVNIAVTTADFAAGGALRTSARVDGSFIADGMRDGVRVQNYTGELRTAVAELADVGASSTAQARPFDVFPLALDEPGFLREYGFIAVVVITATDDASTVPVDTIVSQLKNMRADPTNWLVFGVYLKPAPRLDAFESSFPNRNWFTALDAPSISDGFADILQLQRSTLGAACFEGVPLDVDPETPGAQYECVVEDTDAATHVTTLVPRCGGNVFPCWDMAPDPATCTVGGGVRFSYDRGETGNPYDGGILRGQCLIE